MKKALIIFLVILLASFIIPFGAVIETHQKSSSEKEELVTIFSSQLLPYNPCLL